jgi:hypothetical protein
MGTNDLYYINKKEIGLIQQYRTNDIKGILYGD